MKKMKLLVMTRDCLISSHRLEQRNMKIKEEQREHFEVETVIEEEFCCPVFLYCFENRGAAVKTSTYRRLGLFLSSNIGNWKTNLRPSKDGGCVLEQD